MADASPSARPATRSQRARAQVLKTASELFYRGGVHAVGMEQIVETSGIAKTTIYRHFPTKDALIEAFLNKEDDEFWNQWDGVIAGAKTPRAQLEALCSWIAGRVCRDGYRGCPQLNVAAEFADPVHPARRVAAAHKTQMHLRLETICRAITTPGHAAVTAMQIALLFDGAFMSDGRLKAFAAADLLQEAVRGILGSAATSPERATHHL